MLWYGSKPDVVSRSPPSNPTKLTLRLVANTVRWVSLGELLELLKVLLGEVDR
jgi:hypothetical protein